MATRKHQNATWGTPLIALCAALFITPATAQIAASANVAVKTSDGSAIASATAKESTGATGGIGAAPAQPAQGYVVGESDILRVNVWREPELSGEMAVRPDGNISLPLIHEVKVSGMTTRQIEDELQSLLRTFIRDPQIAVTVVEIRSKNVYITGEVLRPGSYPLLSPMNVLQVIAKAGGFTPFAHRSGIYVLRT